VSTRIVPLVPKGGRTLARSSPVRRASQRVSDEIVPSTGSKLPVVETLIVGDGPAGTAAAKHVDDLPLRRVRRSSDVRVVMLGKGGIWPGMARTNPQLQMGQSGLLLEPDPRHMTLAHTLPFMPTVDFVTAEAQKKKLILASGVLPIDDEILSILKYSKGEYLVRTRHDDEFVARSIVLASGGGPQIDARSLGLVRKSLPRNRRPFLEDTDALSFLMSGGSAEGGTTAILGGGPSAMWAAADARRHHNEVVMIASRDHGGYEGANPGGRNTSIQIAMRGRMYYGEPVEIVPRRILDASDARMGGLIIHVKGFRPIEDSGPGKEMELVVSQVVTAFGGDRVHSFPMLGPYIFNDLQAIADEAGAFTSSPLDAATGLISSDRDMIVVGAAAYRGLSVKGLGLPWTNIAQTLPLAGRPYEGIALSNATIEAIANYVSLGPINYLVANRQQIAESLKSVSSAGEGRRLTVADQVIASRAKLETSDYATFDVAKIIRDGL
jgi:hypothetical protein